MRNYPNLLDKKRFETLEEERIRYLQGLTIKESVKIMESLLNSGMDREFRRIKKEFEKDGV